MQIYLGKNTRSILCTYITLLFYKNNYTKLYKAVCANSYTVRSVPSF